MNISITFISVLRGLNASPSQCPDLVPGPEMTISQVEGYIEDPAVTSHCSEGYVFNTGQLVKFIECVNATSGTEWAPTWNDTVGTCLKKKCPLITSQLGDNMTAMNYENVSEYADTVTITCSPGYAFSVDTNAPVTSRVTSSINVTCEDDLSSASAVWSAFGTCSEVACELPPDANHANIMHSTTTLGSQVIYECLSGYWFVSGTYAVTAICNSSASWEADQGPGWILGVNVHCSKMDPFVGCLEAGSLEVMENATGIIGTIDCRSCCKSRNYRYASLQEDLCSCGDFLVDNFTAFGEEDCSTYCVDYVTNSSSIPVFCGGGGGAMSVYSSLAGCYKDLDIPTEHGEQISEDYSITCPERCRGKNEAIAAVNVAMCYCLNTTNITGTEVDGTRCNQVLNANMTTSQFTMVYDLGKTDIPASSCEELFNLGVRMHGYYYLKEPLRREMCYFKDGTECESGWLGFEGHCYLFGVGSMMNFTDAREYCIANQADLPSITTEEEAEFMIKTRKLFPDMNLDDSKYVHWWIGLYDSRGTKLYSWTDGNVMRYAGFGSGQPSGHEDYQCAQEKALSYWISTDCNAMANVICKKPQGRSECKALHSVPSATYSFTTTEMTLTFCMEKCKGKSTTHAISKGETCWCVDSVPDHDNVSMSDCLDPCPGDAGQFCGGNANHYRVMNVTGRVMAKSCQDLQILGIGNDTFLTSLDNEVVVLEYCIVPECPYSWVLIGSQCYKFYPIATFDVAMETCSKSNAYITTIEDQRELDQLIATASNISIYSGQKAWRIGVQFLSTDDVEMRWSNGHLYDSDIWNDTFVSMDGPEVLIQMNTSTWTADKFSEQAFICEAGQDYIGCYNITDTVGAIPYQSPKMTVQQCVELCRAKYKPLAFVSIDTCLCEDTLTIEEPGYCTRNCVGQFNQNCGGVGVASVYNVSEFTAFAKTCDDLFSTSIFISEQYIINGSVKTCIFKDGTNCSVGWFGYKGHCYQHFEPSESLTRNEICVGENATMTSLTSMDELMVLEEYLQGVQFKLDKSYYVNTGITYGLYTFNVTLSQDGLLTDHGIFANGNVNIVDLYDYHRLVLHNGDGESGDGGVICKHNRYVIGCFNTPTSPSIQPAITQFASMELTLCKQTCIGQNKTVALMGLTECYCMNITQMLTLTEADPEACHRTCPMMHVQMCGNGSVLWAHFTEADEVPLAENCSQLYQNGVFIQQTYKLVNPDRYETCGFTDATQCPASWLGENNKCIKIRIESRFYLNSVKQCAIEGGYVFNPINNETNVFLESILTSSGLFRSISHWQTGIYPVFYNTSYVTSRGEMIVDSNFGPGNPPTDAVYYDNIDQMWYPKPGTTKLPFICEVDSDYKDCVDIYETADASYDSDGNSITMCIYWCKGQGHSYSAVSHTKCRCYATDIASFTSHPGSCINKCPGIQSQTCGTSDHSYYTYIRTQHVPVMPTTCSELYLHGVFMAGYYWIDYNGQNISIHCFSSGALSLITPKEAKKVLASSSKSGHDVSHASLTFPFTSGWKPNENEVGTWLNIKTSNWHLVAGIIFAGIHTDSERSYILTYTVKYRNLLTGSMDVFPYNWLDNVWAGCSSSYQKCSTYPTDPVVTQELVIYPQTWYDGISLQLAIYGQAFSDFNHTDSYLGCYMDGDDSFSIGGTNISIEDCLSLCRDNSKQFSGIDENDQCMCGEPSPNFGYVDDMYCPYNDSTSKRHGTNTYNILAVYKTYNSSGYFNMLMDNTMKTFTLYFTSYIFYHPSEHD